MAKRMFWPAIAGRLPSPADALGLHLSQLEHETPVLMPVGSDGARWHASRPFSTHYFNRVLCQSLPRHLRKAGAREGLQGDRATQRSDVAFHSAVSVLARRAGGTVRDHEATTRQ
jgi:hypothetical protein